MQKSFFKKNFLEPSADLQFCSFSFLNVVDIHLILEFINKFGKYHPVCPKNP